MIRAAIRGGGKITRDGVVAMQADTTTLDGQYFTPVIAATLDRAQRSSTPELAELAKDPRIVEAVGRLGRWNHTFPTGIPEGYDAADRDGRLSPPSQTEIDHSVAATIYALWRARFAINVFDKHVQQISPRLPVFGDAPTPQALRQLLLDFDTRKGVGRSGIDFFAVAGHRRRGRPA
jgi:penicillin G amidase